MHKKSLFEKLAGIVYLPLGLFFAYLAFKFPNYVIMFASIGVLSIPLLLACFILPIGRLRYGETPAPFLPYFIKVILFEAFLVIIFFGGLLTFFGHENPSFSLFYVNLEAIHTTASKYRWLGYSLFPTTLLSIWVLGIGFIYYVRKYGPYPHQTSYGFFNAYLSPVTKGFTETSMYSVNTVCMSILVCMSIVLISFGFQSLFGLLPHTVLSPVTFSLMGFVSMFFMWRFSKKRLIALSKRGLSLSGFILIIFIVTVIVLVYTSVVSEWLLARAEIDINELKCSECYRFFGDSTTYDRLAAFFLGWWLMWIPMGGSIIVKLSNGQTIRNIITAVMVFPLILLATVMIWPQLFDQTVSALGIFNTEIPHTQATVLRFAFGIISMIFVYVLSYKAHNTRLFHAGVLEPLEGMKTGRMSLKHGVKLLGFSRVCMPFFLALMTVIFMQVIGGWYLIQVNLLIFAPLTMTFCYFGMFYLYKQFKQNQLWMHPEKAADLAD